MDNPNLKDPFVQKATKTADGRDWVQRCLVCLKPVDFLKMTSWIEYVRVGNYVRHRKCLPGSIK